MVGPVGELTFYVRPTDHFEKDHFGRDHLSTNQSDDRTRLTYDQVGWNLRACFDFVCTVRALFILRANIRRAG